MPPRQSPFRWKSVARVLAVALVLSAPLALPGAASARDAAADKAMLASMLDHHVMPRVGALRSVAGALPAAVTPLCEHPDAETLAGARAGYGAVMDAWAGVQHLRPGPLLMDMRADRLAFWPDKRGVGSRQLARLLAKRDEAALAPGGLAHHSVALQGLTALERLLFDEGATVAGFSGDAGAYRCQLALAVSRNVAVLADEVNVEWAELGPAILADKPTPVGENLPATVSNLYLSLITAMQVVVDQKLLFPLGADVESAKPTLAEARWSGRSLRAITLNLRAMEAMILGEEPGDGGGFAALLPADADGRKTIGDVKATFAAAIAAVEAVPEPLDASVTDPKARVLVEAAFRAAKAAQDVVAREIPPSLDITVGFNELDGD